MEITEIVDEEERIAALEKRVRYLDAMVRGITAEFLDLRAVTKSIARQEGVLPRQEPAVTVPLPAEAVDQPGGGASGEGSESRPNEESESGMPEPEMARIMQPDGTMKLEPRYGDSKTFDPSSETSRTPRTGFRKKNAP